MYWEETGHSGNSHHLFWVNIINHPMKKNSTSKKFKLFSPPGYIQAKEKEYDK